MNKLVKLLNEYRPAEENCSYELYDKWVDTKKQKPQIWYVENTYADGSVRENQTLYFISKKGGFIKWLVESNKIDYHNKINYDISLAINRVLKKTTREERLLMMLAIQDEPIEFLISILK